MELTAQTFRELDDLLDLRQQIALKAALGSNQFGLLPQSEFNCSGMFVRNTFEIGHFKCLAVLPSGKIVNADEDIAVTIPMLYGDEYYLTVTISDSRHEYEKQGVPYIRPVYTYGIHTMKELKINDLFPVVRFNVSDGLFSPDQNYIPPCLLISANPRFGEYTKRYIEKLEGIITHSNMEDGDGKRSFQRYMFLLKSLQPNESVRSFIMLTQETAQAIDYFIVRPNTGTAAEVPHPDYHDIEKWLRWLEGYLTGSITILDNVVPAGNRIDYDTLLAQAKKELYDRLNPELHESLSLTLKDELYSELMHNLSGKLLSHIDNNLKPELKKRLRPELEGLLYNRLHDELYNKLYEALYIAPEDEEDFIPMI